MACYKRNQTSALAKIIKYGFECQRGNQSHEYLITQRYRNRPVAALALNGDIAPVTHLHHLIERRGAVTAEETNTHF